MTARRLVEFRTKLAMTATGKLMRRELRDAQIGSPRSRADILRSAVTAGGPGLSAVIIVWAVARNIRPAPAAVALQ